MPDKPRQVVKRRFIREGCSPLYPRTALPPYSGDRVVAGVSLLAEKIGFRLLFAGEGFAALPCTHPHQGLAAPGPRFWFRPKS